GSLCADSRCRRWPSSVTLADAAQVQDCRTSQHRHRISRRKSMKGSIRLGAASAIIVAFSATPMLAQPAQTEAVSCLPQGMFPGPASYKSVEQLADGRVTFRLC